MDEIERSLLESLVNEELSNSKGVDRLKFRVKHQEKMDFIDSLEANGLIETRDGKYYVTLPLLLEMEKTCDSAKAILNFCEVIFKFFRNIYRENPYRRVQLNDVSALCGIKRLDVNKAMNYMVRASIFSGYSTNFYAEDAYANPGEEFIKFPDFSAAAKRFDNQKLKIPVNGLAESKYKVHGYVANSYIHEDRILDLKNVVCESYDLSRLIRICEEINSSAENGNYLALGALLRILIDHVPPLLGFKSFGEVASNYSGKSLKEIFSHLENSSRKISNSLLHTQIRRVEALPTFNQVDFSQAVDKLLEEIVRSLRENQ